VPAASLNIIVKQHIIIIVWGSSVANPAEISAAKQHTQKSGRKK
jgi:hypothetical protein